MNDIWMNATLVSPWWPLKPQKDNSTKILLTNLKLCSTTKNLQWGKQLHEEALQRKHTSSIYVATALVNMYAKCGSMVHARQVFDGLKHRDVVSWTALILGYAENGEGMTALDMFAKMKSQGFLPDHLTYVASIKACRSLLDQKNLNGLEKCLEYGKQIQLQSRILCNSYVQSSLIDMFGKCGSMCEARQVFDSMKNPDSVAWTALILGYADQGDGVTALELYSRMRSRGCVPDRVTILAALKACTSLSLEQDMTGLGWGKRIHLEIAEIDIDLENTLIDMYGKCGSMPDARLVFDAMKSRDLVSWNALILGYVENGDGSTALSLFAKLKAEGCAPDSITFVAALKACGLVGALECGHKIHTEALKYGEHNVMVVTSLVDFYAKCGKLEDAQNVFDSYPAIRNIRTWNALLAGYSRSGDDQATLELFQRMKDATLVPNDVTFLSILTCYSHAGLEEKAKHVFEIMESEFGMRPSVLHYTCMVDMFGRFNKLDLATSLLQRMARRGSTIAWRTILGASCKWKSIGVGRLSFTSLLSLDNADPAAYVLLAHIYGSQGMWEEQELVLNTRTKLKQTEGTEESSWATDLGTIHAFRSLNRLY